MLQYDELGQYFADGIDTLAAQMRGLGYMGVFSSQDHPSLARGANGQEKSLMANTRTKYFESVEDEKTFEILRKSVGRDFYSELSAVTKTPRAVTTAYEDNDEYQIREKDRIDIRELRSYTEGQGVISFQDALVRSAAFYIPDDDKLSSRLPLRINRFIEVLPPNPSTLDDIYPEVRDKEISEQAEFNFPPISLKGYDREVNSLLESLECFYEINAGRISQADLSVCLFEVFSDWLDDKPADDKALYQLQDDPFPILAG